MKWTWVGFVALGLWPLPFAGQTSPAAEAPAQGAPSGSYAQALEEQADHQFTKAARLFRAAAAEAGTPEDAELREAQALVDAGDVGAAEPPLRAYLTRVKGSARGMYLLGYVLEREGRARDSLAVFTQAAAIRQPGAEDLRLVALDYVLLDDYADAVHWLQRSLAFDGRNAETWYDLGRAEMHEGSFADAERDFERSLALAPGNSRALDNLGLSLEAQNRTPEALQAYERAVAVQHAVPSRATEQPLLNLGTLLNTENRSGEAVAPLREAVGLAPRSSRCHEELARAYLGTHQDALARAEFEQAIALDGANPRLHYQLGQLCRRLRDTAAADAELKTSAALYGSHSSTPAPH